jgi:hypothetical protein
MRSTAATNLRDIFLLLNEKKRNRANSSPTNFAKTALCEEQENALAKSRREIRPFNYAAVA